MKIQFAVKEARLRPGGQSPSSRTVPFVQRRTHGYLAKAAGRVMVGQNYGKCKG